ncbi:MAG: hypothetical protein WC719_03425 [Patescibacteria group bacterium]|jgi:hypothetical protein
MQILKINKVFFDSLNEEENLKLLRVYDYSDRESFLNDVIKKLNDEYNFLSISGYDFFNSGESGLYHMYNGYVSGDLEGLKEVVVSFTTLYGKSGNVWFNQQVMPMVTSKLARNKDFLIDDKIKKICLLTTHKSEIMSKEKNETTWDSNIQMTVNFANNLGFEFIEVFPIKNLNIAGRYNTVEEIIEHTNFLQASYPTNSQFKQLRIENGVLVASFEKEPKGQEQKAFALKLLATTHILKGKNIDISLALKQTKDYTIKVLNEYIEYIKTIDSKLYPVLNISSELEIVATELTEVEEEIAEEPINIAGLPEFKIPVTTAYNSKGKKIFTTQKRYKIQSMEAHDYMCGCHSKEHLYFTANSTKENFVEGHHMIPMEYQHQYWTERKINLDCPQNITPLCPHCHSKIHNAIPVQKSEVISELFHKYKDNLQAVDPELNFPKFASFYHIYIY